MAQKHRHHIVPKHVGGSDDPSNIVYLTVEEHAEAHRELYEKHGRWQDQIAWKGLSGQITMSAASKTAQKKGSARGGQVTKSIIEQRVKDGTFHFLSGEIQKRTQLERSQMGTHNFIHLNQKRISEGTHNLVGTVTCRDKQGNVIQVPSDKYNNQKKSELFPIDWEYASVASKEGKRRKK